MCAETVRVVKEICVSTCPRCGNRYINELGPLSGKNVCPACGHSYKPRQGLGPQYCHIHNVELDWDPEKGCPQCDENKIPETLRYCDKHGRHYNPDDGGFCYRCKEEEQEVNPANPDPFHPVDTLRSPVEEKIDYSRLEAWRISPQMSGLLKEAINQILWVRLPASTTLAEGEELACALHGRVKDVFEGREGRWKEAI